MTKLNLTEIELAERWGVSPKTLQRWRSERRGPSYIKLSKRVTYPIEDILAFESSQKKVRQNSHAFTVQQAAALAPQICTEDPPAVAPPDDNALVSWEEAIRITKLPSYFFTNAEVRKRLEIPHYHVGRHIRFRLKELRQWEIFRACQAFGISADATPSTIQNEESTPNPEAKMGLREALRRLNNGTLVK